MASPVSTASATISRPEDPFEPDAQWRADLHKKIRDNLQSMIQEAKDLLKESLEKYPARRETLENDYHKTMKNIRKIADDTYRDEIERERQERRWVLGGEINPAWKESMEKEQQAIMDMYKSEKAAEDASQSQPADASDADAIISQQESGILLNDHNPNGNSESHPTSTSNGVDSFTGDGESISDSESELLRPPQDRQSVRAGKQKEKDSLTRISSESPPTRSSERLSQPRTDRDHLGGSSRPSPERDIPSSKSFDRSKRSSLEPYPLTPSPSSHLYWTPPPNDESSSNTTLRRRTSSSLRSDDPPPPPAPQRRGSTASVRSTGSTSFRPSPCTLPIPEKENGVAAKAEQERRGLQEVDQQWSRMEARDKGRDRGGPRSFEQAHPPYDYGASHSPGPGSVSSSPSQSRRPPTPPLKTKPVYRKTSFIVEGAHGIDRRPSIQNLGGGPSLISSSRPPDLYGMPSQVDNPRQTTPISTNGSYTPMSTTMAYATESPMNYYPAYTSQTPYTNDSPARDPDRYFTSTPSSPPSHYPNPTGSIYIQRTAPPNGQEDDYSRYYNQSSYRGAGWAGPGPESLQQQRGPLPEAWRTWSQRPPSIGPRYSSSDLRNNAQQQQQQPRAYGPHPGPGYHRTYDPGFDDFDDLEEEEQSDYGPHPESYYRPSSHWNALEAKQIEAKKRAAREEARLLEEEARRKEQEEKERKERERWEEERLEKERVEKERLERERQERERLERERIERELAEKERREKEERERVERERVERERREKEEAVRKKAEEVRRREEALERRKREAAQRRKEAELRKKEEEIKRMEEEFNRIQEEEMRQLREENQRREAELLRQAKEAKKKEEEAKRREAEARRKEQEARKREEEIKEKEAILKAREEELKRKEQQAKIEETRRQREETRRRKEEERRRREEERRQKEEEEERQREEERRQKEEEERIRREEEERAEREEQERIYREEEERQRREEEWRREEEKRREEQREEEERRQREEAEMKRRQEEEAAQRENERKSEELARKLMEEEEQRLMVDEQWRPRDESKKKADAKEAAARAYRQQQEAQAMREREKMEAQWKKMHEDKKRDEETRKQEERRREEEVRKKQESSSGSGFGWESWAHTPSSTPWAQASRPQQTTASGTSTPNRSSASSSAWSTSSKSSFASSAASASSKTSSSSSTASNWTSPTASDTTTSSTPTPKGRSGSTGASGAPFNEADWQRRQEEYARQQQERFIQEQDRMERERLNRAAKTMTKDDVIAMFDNHERLWQRMSTTDQLRWDHFPWPMFKRPASPEEITLTAISAYILSPHYPEKDKSRPEKDRIKEHIRRWHPDRFETKMLSKVIESDKEKVREGAGFVVRSLNDLLTKSNTRLF